MKLPVDHAPVSRSCRLLATGLLLALPLLSVAQNAEPVTKHHAHGATHEPAPTAQPEASSGMDHAYMHGMTPDAKPATPHHAMPGMDHSLHDMKQATPPVSPMHGSAAADDLRSPDYSDGIDHGDMPGMHMLDNQPLAMLRVDQLEATHGRDANGQAWAVQGWYGNDSDKLWLRSEGERHRGRVGGAEVELLWNHAIAPFWDTQLGVRQDLGDGPQRHWAAFGVQGLAPYWFELEATAYVGPAGRIAARLHVEYELLFTQRLILQPEFELNLHGRNDVATRTGRGLSDTKLGLRLRYEIRRELAPYIGVVWTHRYGASADYARQAGEPAMDRQFVAGVRFWF